MINCFQVPYNGTTTYSLTKRVGKYTAKSIALKVSYELGINMSDMKSKSRKRPIVIARQIAMYFIRKYTKTTLKQIGKMFGNRDHSTVIYSCDTVEDLMQTNKKFNSLISRINRSLYEN